MENHSAPVLLECGCLLKQDSTIMDVRFFTVETSDLRLFPLQLREVITGCQVEMSG